MAKRKRKKSKIEEVENVCTASSQPASARSRTTRRMLFILKSLKCRHKQLWPKGFSIMTMPDDNRRSSIQAESNHKECQKWFLHCQGVCFLQSFYLLCMHEGCDIKLGLKHTKILKAFFGKIYPTKPIIQSSCYFRSNFRNILTNYLDDL